MARPAAGASGSGDREAPLRAREILDL